MKETEQSYKVSTPCLDDHHFKKEELESVVEFSKACSQIVLTCLYFARIVKPDILWSVNKLARAVTKWTRACDRCLARVISYIHITNDHQQHFHVGHTSHSDFAGGPEDSESNSGTSCVSSGVEHSFPQYGCVRNKRQCLTVPQNRKPLLWMLVCVWTDSLLLICGMR